MHDSKSFRESAQRCEQLARDEPNENIRKLFLDIAARWQRLADEVDGDTQQKQSVPIEPKIGSGS